MKTPHELVMEWHRTYNVPIGDFNTPDFPENEVRWELREVLIDEEYKEFKEASASSDFIEVLDALGDLIYVIYGAAIECGVNLDYILAEIQRSNMSKLGEDGKPIYREDGKVLKGPNYSPPRLIRALISQKA